MLNLFYAYAYSIFTWFMGFLGFIGLFGLYYWHKNKYDDVVVELFTVVHDDLKCIKYQYRGKKYLYLTYDMCDDINRIQKEIHPINSENDKQPVPNYKDIMATIKLGTESCYLSIDAKKMIYSFIGPPNTYYFAFDTKFYEKMTKFMNYLFLTNEGAITYGRLSSLLHPDVYFNIKNRIREFYLYSGLSQDEIKQLIKWNF